MKHSISREEVIAVLKRRGFQNVGDRPRVYAESYLHPVSDEVINIKANDSNPLVIHPKHEGWVSRLLELPGVIRGSKRYNHSRAFNGLPQRINNGQKPENYGIDFGFASVVAVDGFLDVLLTSGTGIAATAELDIANATDLPKDETEREAVIAARRGQGRFRRSLDEVWGSCAVTGCTNRALLRASHIKPWRNSDNGDRLNPHNGLLLAAHLDSAFDSGLISFSDKGGILVDPRRLSATDAKTIGIHGGMRLREIDPRHVPYLVEHRRLHGFHDAETLA